MRHIECKGTEWPDTPDQWRWYDDEWHGECGDMYFMPNCDDDFATPPACDEVIIKGQCVGIPLYRWGMDYSDKLDRMKFERNRCDSSGTARSLDCDDKFQCVYGDNKPLTYRVAILAKCPDVESDEGYDPYYMDRAYWANGPYRWDRPTE